ncbi:hypothetical protein [Streptomyces ureilyticus]|uniref:Uncharacterized protein n=1 Tax=Streptomyces ureilyticus TaxID=1775131 RepID=A0ABX0E695_9ACTN|nr:hypothetical protein [Streptomyces ureilyticus]NGO48990.1 hypothetical protein [Streptomyces ureilyticus]
MSLAILRLLDTDQSGLRFSIDTGTNPFYELTIGREVRRDDGYSADTVDEVEFRTPMAVNDQAGFQIDTRRDVTVPADGFSSGRMYAQLFSYASRDGRSPAFSRVVTVPVLHALPWERPTTMSTTFRPARQVACRTLSVEFAVASPPAPAPSSMVNSRAVLSFVPGLAMAWNGRSAALFARDRDIRLQVSLNVGRSGPGTPLPKAILTIRITDPTDSSVLLDRAFRLRQLQPGVVIDADLTQAELAQLPTGHLLSVSGELRWPGSAGQTYRTTATTELVLVGRYFVKEQGSAVPGSQELTDMTRFRPYWNKIWESPVSHDGTYKVYHWALEAAVRYSVLIEPAALANGLMETRMLRTPPAADSTIDRAEGRMKAGIELSLSELNKLASLWPGGNPLAPDRLAAFSTADFARQQSRELVHSVKLKGRTDERGMVWVVPVFSLRNFVVSAVREIDAYGRVLGVDDEQVALPLPDAVRLIGLTSGSSGDVSSADGEATYAFEGFGVEFADLVQLMPAGQNSG